MILKPRLPLTFTDQKVEEDFLSEYRIEAVSIFRWAIAVMGIFMVAFMWQDSELSSIGYRATNIRIYLAIPLCILTWYLVGIKAMQKYIEWISALFILVYSALTAAIYLVFEPGFYGLSGAMGATCFLMFVFGTFTLSYLRFIWASLVCIGIIFIYVFSVLTWTKFNAEEFINGYMANIALGYLLGSVTCFMFEVFRRRQFTASRHLAQEREHYRQLLFTLVPSAIASRIELGEFPIADSQAEVAILFSDLVGFTTLTKQVSPRALVQLLNELFSEFDKAAEHNCVEKIKTIGDGYMAACGVPVAEEQRTIAIANLALDMVAITKRIAEKNHLPISIRVGIHTGSLVAGVIGMNRYTYDMWGESVNIASRMESSGVPNRVQISESAFLRLKDHFSCEAQGEIDAKGVGLTSTYLLGLPLVASSPRSLRKVG
ncbi:MAG: adenylate/guanylate cyclase domain-containing protein [Pseudomonadota bacterium]